MASDLEIKSQEDPETYGRLTTVKRRGVSFAFPNVAILPPPQSLENQEQLKVFNSGIFERYRKIGEDDFSGLKKVDKTGFYQKLRFSTRKVNGESTFNMLLFELSFFPNDINALTDSIYATRTDVIISPAFNKKLILLEKSQNFTTKYLEFLDKFVASAKFRNKREMGISIPITNTTREDFEKILQRLKKHEIRFVIADFQGTGPFHETRVEKMHMLNRQLDDQFRDNYFIYGVNIRHPSHGTGILKLIPAEEMFSVGLGIDGLGNNHVPNYNPDAVKIDIKKMSPSRDLKIFNQDTYLYDLKQQKALENTYAGLMSC
ncbi:hypothetical protein COV61_02715, partial [Candidatus Micrarchaeota archaeon CG11_big_fil_rev_8_21_14_0_20_47_5]